MKSKLLTIFLGLILLSAIIFLGNFILNKNSAPTGVEKMTALPGSISKTIKPSPTSTLIEFHFDKTTDLKSELNSINPEVLNSDFDSLKQTITSL